MVHAGSLGAIVADFGGCNTKIGFAGDDHPQVYSSSVCLFSRSEI